MIKSLAKKAHKPTDECVVLLLQADWAYWFKVAGSQIQPLHCQAIGSAHLSLESDAPWLVSRGNNSPVKVELILDTVMDELDVVTVEQSPHPFINRYRQWVTLRRLRADYPSAQVSSVPGEYADKVASLMHLVIPDTWSSWLFELQSNGVVFTRAATGTQVVKNWASGIKASGVYEKFMLVMPVADYQRHILIDRGAILALRTSQRVHQSEHESEYCESVLLQTALQIEPALLCAEQPLGVVIPAIRSVNSDDAIQNASGYTPPIEKVPSGIDGALNSIHQLETECLIAMVSGLPVGARQLLLHDNQLTESDGQNLTTEMALIGGAQCNQSTSRVMKSYRQFLKSRTAETRGWSLRQSFAWHMPEFAPSVAYSKYCQRVRWLTGIAATCALTAAFFTIQAVGSGIVGHQIIQQQIEKRHQLEQEYEQLQATAAFVHPDIAAAAQSLRMSDLLDSGYGMSPQNLLESLGTVLTSMPSIMLDTLIWVSTDSKDDYESLTYVLSSVPHRQSLDVADAPAVQQVEIAGFISANSLKSQKRQFDQFIKALQSISGAGHVIVLESPIDSALSSDINDNAAGGFRLSFTMRTDQ